MPIDQTKIAGLVRGTANNDILGDEELDPRTNLTVDELKRAMSYVKSNPSTKVYRGTVPKAYERILGEGNYHPEFGYERTQELLADRQSHFGQTMNMLNQGIVGEVIGGTIEGVGYLAALQDLGSVINGTEQEYGNWLIDVGQDLKTWSKDVSPIYQQPDAPKFNPSDWSWWMSNGSSVMSTLSLMLPAAGVVRGLGMLGKAMNIGQNLSKTAKWMATGLSQATVSRHMENMMEASGVYKEVYDKRKEDLNREYGSQIQTDLAKVTSVNPGREEEVYNKWQTKIDKEARENAALAASNTYRKQWAMLLQDIPQYLLLNKLGGMGPSAAERSAQVAKKMGMNMNQFYGKKSGMILKDMLGEGGEEMYQFLVNEQSKSLIKAAGDPLYNDSLMGLLKENFDNGEMWTSATFGALGAGVMQGAFAGINAKAIRKSNEARIKNINEFGPAYAHAYAVMQEAIDSKDEFKKDSALANYTYNMTIPAIEHDNVEHLKSFLEALKDPKDDTLDRFNIPNDPSEKFLAENPDVADQILKNVDKITKLYNQYKKEGETNPNIQGDDIIRFARSMTQNRFLIDSGTERVQNAKQRLSAMENIDRFDKFSSQARDIKETGYEVKALAATIKKIEKQITELPETAKDEQVSYNHLKALLNLQLDQLRAELKEKKDNYKLLSKETIEEDKLLEKDLNKDDVEKFIKDTQNIKTTEALIEKTKADMERYREGKAFTSTPEQRADQDQDLGELEGVTIGDKVSYVDQEGKDRVGEVESITVGEYDGEGNLIENADAESADNIIMVQPIDENGEKDGDPIAFSGDKVTVVDSSKLVDGELEVEEGLSFEEEDNAGIQRSQASEDDMERSVLNPISNLSWSHTDPDDRSIIEIRNDKLNKVLSDPNTDFSDARAYYYFNKTALEGHLVTLEKGIKEMQAIRKENNKIKDPEHIALVKKNDERINKGKRQKELVQKIIDGTLTKGEKSEVLGFSSGTAFNDLGDTLPIAVRLVVGGNVYTKGLMLHASGYNRIKIPASEKHREKAYKQEKKEESRLIRSQIIKKIIIDKKAVYTDGIRLGRGVPRTLPKSLPKKDRIRSVLEQLGIIDPNTARLAIAKSQRSRKGYFYKPKLKTAANRTETYPKEGTVKSPGSVYIYTNKTPSGEEYALKLNKTNVSRDHAELIYDAFRMLARSNVTFSKRLQKWVPRKNKENKGVGRYALPFEKEDTRVFGLTVGELLDLLVVHGKALTDPDDTARYQYASLNEAHKAELRKKRLYLATSPDKEAVPYLYFGNKADGTPYQVDLRRDKEIRDNKEIFIKWMTENKTYATHIVNKMLGAEINGGLLNGKVFRIGEKGKPGTITRERGDNYTAFLLKNGLVNTDLEKDSETGSLFHAPTVNLKLLTGKNNKVNLKVEGVEVGTPIPKPEVKVEEDSTRAFLQTDEQKQKEKSKTKKKASVNKNMPYVNQFNSATKRNFTIFNKGENGIPGISVELKGAEFSKKVAEISLQIEDLIAEGLDPKAIVDRVMIPEEGALYVLGSRGLGQYNKTLVTFLDQRFAGITKRTLAQELDYGSTLKTNEPGLGAAVADKRNKPVPEELGEPVETQVAAEPVTEEDEGSSFLEEDELKEVKDQERKAKSVKDIMGKFTHKPGDNVGREYTNGDYKRQDIIKELAWVANRLGIEKDTVRFTNKLSDLLRDGRNNWALYSHSAILLLEAAEEGTLYHEAFHRVSLGYLSKEERDNMYRIARQVYRMPKNMYSDKRVEERLAEEFREYVLLRENNKPSGLRRIFQDIIDFFTTLFYGVRGSLRPRLAYTEVEQLFQSAYRGDFKFSKVAIENVDNISADQYARQRFNTIPTRKQLKNVTKQLASMLFTLNNTNLNNPSNIRFELLENHLENIIEELALTKEEPTFSQEERDDAEALYLMFKEVLGEKSELGEYGNFEIFKELILDYFNFLGIRIKYNKEYGNNDNDLDEETEVVSRGDNDYNRPSYLISIKDTAQASIKFMISTLYESDQIDPVTRFQPFVNFNEVWSMVLHDLHDHTSIAEMIETLTVIGEEFNYYPYKQLVEILDGKDTSENTKIQFLTTIRKHKHTFVNFLFNWSPDSETGARFRINDAGYDELSRSSNLIWNEMLWANDEISSFDKDGNRVANEKYFDAASEEITRLSKIVEDNLENETFTKELEDEIVNGIVSLLNSFHITLDDRSVRVYTNSQFSEDTFADRLSSVLSELGELLTPPI